MQNAWPQQSGCLEGEFALLKQAQQLLNLQQQRVRWQLLVQMQARLPDYFLLQLCCLHRQSLPFPRGQLVVLISVQYFFLQLLLLLLSVMLSVSLLVLASLLQVPL